MTFAELLVRKHTAIATTLFSASVLGSFYYTVRYGRSAFVDANTLISGETLTCMCTHQVKYQASQECPFNSLIMCCAGKAAEEDDLPAKATYSYQLKFR